MEQNYFVWLLVLYGEKRKFQSIKHVLYTVAHKCHAKIVIFFHFSDFFSDFFSGLKLHIVGDCKVEIHARGWSRKSKKPIMMILLIFSVSFIQSFSDALIYNQWYCHFLWILLRQPIQWNISVDCSRLVQPRFLRILLSCLRLSRIP